MTIVLDGVVVRHTNRPAAALYERSPLMFSAFVMLALVLWILIAGAVGIPPWLVALGVPIVLAITGLAPLWLELRAYDIEGPRVIIVDERGLQVERTLIPWAELRFQRHGDRESSLSMWRIGPDTIIANFEYDGQRFSAFLGVRFRSNAPIVISEILTKSLSENESLRLSAMIEKHLDKTQETDKGKKKNTIDLNRLWSGEALCEGKGYRSTRLSSP